MKIVLVLLSVVALAAAQVNFECQCGLFVTVPMATLEVYRLLPANLQSCNEWNECSLICFREWTVIKENGGLDYIPPQGNVTLKEQSCSNLANVHGLPDLEPTPTYTYYRMCESPWVWDSGSLDQDLCCAGGVPC